MCLNCGINFCLPDCWSICRRQTPSGLSDLLKIREPLLILAWKNSANRLTSRKISGIRLYWTDKNSMIYYYIMHACSKPERYGQARFVEKVNIHAASANSRSSACKIAFALQMPARRPLSLKYLMRAKVGACTAQRGRETAQGQR